jgi:hypothetical protein
VCAWNCFTKRLQGVTVVDPAWKTKPGRDGGFKQ